MHDEVIRYSLDGEVGDNNIVKHRERLIQFVEAGMRDEGVIPNLDLEPQFTLDYDPNTETYKFILSVYGVYHGREAWEVAGTKNGKKISSSTVPVR